MYFMHFSHRLSISPPLYLVDHVAYANLIYTFVPSLTSIFVVITPDEILAKPNQLTAFRFWDKHIREFLHHADESGLNSLR